MTHASDHAARCGVILAAGEGKRLQPLVRQLRGDALPKQYVTFVGRRSMLEHTFERVERLLPPEHIFAVVSETHLGYPAVRRQLSGRPQETVIAQPENKDTAAGILLPLMHIYKQYPESTVAVFPSDHFVLEEELFMSHVSIAFHAVERNPSLMVLLGVEPNEPEPEYGYVLPNGESGENSLGLTMRRVSRFVEKPTPDFARELILKGGLWNTMVMVFKVKTLLDVVRNIHPQLYASFQEGLKTIGTRDEARRIKEIYRELRPVNFSKGILELLPLNYPSCLSVLSVRGVIWSDWGLPRSIQTILKRIDCQERLYNGQNAASANRLWSIFSDVLQLERENPCQRKEITEVKKRPARRAGFHRFPQRSTATTGTR